MRETALIYLVTAVLGACTKQVANPTEPDAAAGNHPPPRVIPGGGISDGAIDGVVNLYVIDDRTRLPVPGATVRVGAIDGKTDPTGLFVARGVTGAQTVIATATGYRSEVWVGANGANLTVDLQPAVAPAPGHADLSGQIPGFAAISVPAGHVKIASVAYSQTDDLGDPGNTLKTAGDANVCSSVNTTDGCAFKVTVRAGHIGLIAAIVDLDPKGNSDPSDDTITLLRWASRPAITVADGVAQTGQDLALIDPASMATTTIDFGAPPSTLGHVNALIGVDTTGDGTYQLPFFGSPAARTVRVPSPGALGGTSYRLTAIAQDTTSDTSTQSVVLRRGLTGSTLAAGAWLVPPASVSVTRTSASWSGVPGASVVGLEFTQGSSPVTHLLDITVFDGSTSVAIPALAALPAGGAGAAGGVIDAKLSAIGATGLDLTNFALDADRDKLDRVAGVPITVTN